MDQLQTGHGIFTGNEVTGQTAEEVYAQWLIDKDKPQPISEIDQLRLEVARGNAELFETMIMFSGGVFNV